MKRSPFNIIYYHIVYLFLFWGCFFSLIKMGEYVCVCLIFIKLVYITITDKCLDLHNLYMYW